jgi:hypothetical protein
LRKPGVRARPVIFLRIENPDQMKDPGENQSLT